MKIYIKNMVCLRCKMIIQDELLKLGFETATVELGSAEIPQVLSKVQTQQLELNLKKWGFELITDKRSRMIEKIKNIIITMIHLSDELPVTTYSAYISQQMHLDYNYISNQFVQATGITIQQFIIVHKIEKVKELIACNEMSLTEISYKLQYSSLAHLSAQFKRTTGFSPSVYKLNQVKREAGLEAL